MKIRTFSSLSLLLFIAIVTVLYYKMTIPVPSISNFSEKQKIAKEDEVVPQKPELPELIIKLNEKSQKIKNAHAAISLRTWRDGISFKIFGTLSYEKDKKFRMRLSSLFGEELDIGSNEEIFWYWSKNDPDPGVHWAKHEDHNKTRLKSPFNPLFIMKTLCLEQIDQDNCEILNSSKELVVIYKGMDGTNRPIMISQFLSKQTGLTEGFMITDMEANSIATVEITRFDNEGFPQRIVYYWHQEKVFLQMEFKETNKNVEINPVFWNMPNIKPQLNMAED